MRWSGSPPRGRESQRGSCTCLCLLLPFQNKKNKVHKQILINLKNQKFHPFIQVVLSSQNFNFVPSPTSVSAQLSKSSAGQLAYKYLLKAPTFVDPNAFCVAWILFSFVVSVDFMENPIGYLSVQQFPSLKLHSWKLIFQFFELNLSSQVLFGVQYICCRKQKIKTIGRCELGRLVGACPLHPNQNSPLVVNQSSLEYNIVLTKRKKIDQTIEV